MNLKITKKTKNCLLISILLAFVLCVFGFLGILNKKQEKITAGAVTSTSTEKLYWESGASILMQSSDAKIIRWTLHVHQDVMEGNAALAFTYNATDREEISFSRRYSVIGDVDSTTRIVDYGEIVAGLSIAIGNSGLSTHWGSDGWVVLRVALSVPIFENVSLTANVYKNSSENITDSAESDERNWLYVYNAYTSATGTTSANVWAEEIKGFTSTVDSEEFILHDDYWVDSVRGVSMLANIPQTYKELTTKGSELVEESFGWNNNRKFSKYQKFESYFFVLQYCGAQPNLTPAYAYNDSYTLYYKGIAPGILNENTVVELHSMPDKASGGFFYMGIIKKTTEQSRKLLGDDWTTTESYEAVDWSNAVYVKASTKAEEILGMDGLDLSDEERIYLMDVAGTVPVTDTVPMNVIYKKLSNTNDPASTVTVTETINLKSTLAYSKTSAIQTAYSLLGINDVSAFNVVYSGEYVINDYVYNYGKKILLQAAGYEYVYNDDTQTGELTVVYNDFQYKDFSIIVKNNDPENPLIMNCYTAEVSTSTIDGVSYTNLTFDYSKMENGLYGACLWLVEFEDDDFTISAQVPVGVAVQQDGSKLIVRFAEGAESKLLNLSIVAMAEIVEDVACYVNYEYAKLSIVGSAGQIKEETVTSEPILTTYSQVVLYDNWSNFVKTFGTVVYDAVELDNLEGNYFVPIRTTRRENEPTEDGTPSYTLVVGYRYNTIFRIADVIENRIENVRYKELNDTSLIYYGDDFVDANTIPNGYRFKHFIGTGYTRITSDEENRDDYTKTKIEVLVGANTKTVVDVYIGFTDKWNLTFDYFETYNNTPFALKKTYTGEISVKDYPNIYALTATDICNIAGIPRTVVGIIQLSETLTSVTFDNVSTYTVKLSYGTASLRTIDYNGTPSEVEIPISKYEDWVAGMGNPDWTIMMLNTKDNQYFRYTNEVKREDLYGLFSTAIFEERLTDLNYYFKNTTGDGCVVQYNYAEAKGSSVYKFFYDMTDNGSVVAGMGRVGMFFCELVNDDNKTYHSYAFYLDGSRTDNYLANNGADDGYDEDSSLENKGEDIKDNIEEGLDKIEGVWEGVKDKTQNIFNNLKGWYEEQTKSPWGIALQAALGVVVVVAIAGVCVWIWRFFTGKPKTRRKKK